MNKHKGPNDTLYLTFEDDAGNCHYAELTKKRGRVIGYMYECSRRGIVQNCMPEHADTSIAKFDVIHLYRFVDDFRDKLRRKRYEQ